MIYEKGINDMYKNWTVENEHNKKVYKKWHNMLRRCYSDKFHKKQPTYKDCTVCNRWLLLSNFVEDYKLIDGYDEEKFMKGELSLDKDIKSNGENKEYSFENCMWVSKSENTKQSNKTMDYSFLHNRIGEKHPGSKKIAQYDLEMNLIKVWSCSMDIERELGIRYQNIIKCCKWYECGENKTEWYKTHKDRPSKTLKGFIFKYAAEE